MKKKLTTLLLCVPLLLSAGIFASPQHIYFRFTGNYLIYSTEVINDWTTFHFEETYETYEGVPVKTGYHVWSNTLPGFFSKACYDYADIQALLKDKGINVLCHSDYWSQKVEMWVPFTCVEIQTW